MNQQKLEIFQASYTRNLARAVVERPQDYQWPIEELPTVTARMLAAIGRGSYNKDSYAFRWTCKELGLPFTYKAINAYLER